MSVLLLLLATTLTACSSSSGPQPSGAMMPTGPRVTMNPTGPVAENVVPSGAVRQQLVKAAATKRHLPASDFTGLDPSSVYYAYDDSTHTYWAGAALVPSPKSQAAQTSVQDNGSYDVFKRPPGGQWKVFDVGAAGTGGTTCPVTVPPEVLERWHWSRHACHP